MLLHTLCMPGRPCSRHATAQVCVQRHPHLLHPAKPLSIQCLSVPELSNNATINTSDAMAATQPAVCMMHGRVRQMHAQKSAHTTHCTCNNHIITINPISLIRWQNSKSPFAAPAPASKTLASSHQTNNTAAKGQPAGATGGNAYTRRMASCGSRIRRVTLLKRCKSRFRRSDDGYACTTPSFTTPASLVGSKHNKDLGGDPAPPSQPVASSHP